jgi:hypothetical protein
VPEVLQTELLLLEIDADFTIYLNDVKVSAEKMDGTGADEFISKEYPVPSGINDKEPAIIKFKASPGSKTAAVYDIRLLK